MFRKSAQVFALIATFAAAVAVEGCTGGGDTDCTSECQAGFEAVYCLVGLQTHVICSIDQTTAALQCDGAGGDWAPATVCESDGETFAQEDPDDPWQPDREIIFDEEVGAYVIDQVFFEEIKADPAPLNHDSTVLRQLESGHYQLLYVGELADALGWQPEDVFLSVDGYAMTGITGFVDAYAHLADNNSFEVTIKRGRNEVVLRYRVE